MGGKIPTTSTTIINPNNLQQPVSGQTVEGKLKARVETVCDSEDDSESDTKEIKQDNFDWWNENETATTEPETDSDSESEIEVEETKDVNSEVIIVILNEQTGCNETFRVLLDSGTSGCLGTHAAAKRAGLRIHSSKKATTHNTAAGKFTTTLKAKIKSHKLLELNSRRTLGPRTVTITTSSLGDYDFIFGRKYMRLHGIILDFKEAKIIWDGMEKPMRPKDKWAIENIEQLLEDSETTDEHDEYATEIKESKYEKQDLNQIALNQIHLPIEQRNKLCELLNKYPDLFEGKLGLWPDGKISVELKKDAEPYHCKRPFPIPHIHLETLKKEVERLVEIGVLEPVNGMMAGPWCAPSFIIPKKDGRVRFITDYRRLNRWIKRKPWPMPHINDMLNDIGKFTYVTALDLSMGFYHFELDEELKQLTTFMLPWGLYRYKRLPMGLCVSPDLFQEHMTKLFAGVPYVKVFIDDILIFSNGTYEDHLEKVQTVLE